VSLYSRAEADEPPRLQNVNFTPDALASIQQPVLALHVRPLHVLSDDD